MGPLGCVCMRVHVEERKCCITVLSFMILHKLELFILVLSGEL